MGIIQDNLYKKALRDRKHLMLFGKNGVGIDKIKLVSYSATEISKLTNAQIQNVIDQVILKTTISDHQTDPIFASRHWINILIYIENLAVTSIIMELLMRHNP